jgi:FkbM family methyltransferase
MRKIKNKAKKLYKKGMFNLSAMNSPLYTGFYKHFYTPEPNSMAEFIDYFSKHTPHIRVIQIGANDGFNNDPIHRFIKRDKWEGILLEPQPNVYEEYLTKLHRNSKGIQTLNAALDYTNGSRPLYKIAQSESRWATGLSTFNREALEKNIESGSIAVMLKNEGKIPPARAEDYITEVPVPCITSEELLRKYNIKQLDWLQIDTEGFDFEIIKMFNIPKIKPKVIVFENHHLSEADKQECSAFLQKEGYKLRVFKGDTMAMYQPEAVYQRFFI